MTWSDPARRLAHRSVFPAAEHAWAGAAWLTGRALQAKARPASWTSADGGRVVVVAPHADDETLGAGGASALHVAAGDEVSFVVVTDGSTSKAGGLGAEEMVRRRKQEVEAAAAVLGVQQLVCLGLPEGRWDKGEAAQALQPLLDGAKVLYAPSCVDFHPEHVAVARLLGELAGSDQLVRAYEVGVPLTPVLTNCIADIRTVAPLKARALAEFRTQRLSVDAAVRLGRYRSRLYGLEAAEVFWQLPGDVYARVMALGDWRGGPSPFRGVRGRPFTDPLSAFVGLRDRLALRRAAAAGVSAAQHTALGAVPG